MIQKENLFIQTNSAWKKQLSDEESRIIRGGEDACPCDATIVAYCGCSPKVPTQK